MATRNATTGRPFSIDMLRLPLAALGIFGVLAGIGAWLVEGQFSTLARILIAAGILLLGIYVALDPEDVWARISGRGALYSGNTLVIAVAALAILGLVNVLASRYQTKLDLTANKQFSLSDQSVQIAESLPQPVKVTAFLSGNDSRHQDFQTLLNDYSARSGGKLTYEFIDPEQRPGEAIAAGVTSVPTIVYQMGDKKQDSTGTTERDISTALVKLTRPEKKIYFTAGHGERRLDGSDQQDYSQLKSALERNNFKTDTLDLISKRSVPDDAAEVVIAGPTNPFLPEEKDALRAYLDGGGKLFLLMGPGPNAGDFNDLLNKWEVGFTGNLVVDPTRNFGNDIRVPVVLTYGSHAVTKDLRLATFYPGATNITYPSTPTSGATIIALAQSSSDSWGNTNQQQIQKQDSDPKGPLALAVAIEQQVGGGQQSQDQQSQRSSRLVLIGTPNIVANFAYNVSSGNQDLFLQAANWLAEEDNLINVRAPQPEQRQMLLTGTQLNLVIYSSLLFLPLAVLAAGAAVWWTRR